jgi:hypothetical protein
MGLHPIFETSCRSKVVATANRNNGVLWHLYFQLSIVTLIVIDFILLLLIIIFGLSKSQKDGRFWAFRILRMGFKDKGFGFGNVVVLLTKELTISPFVR